MKKTLLGLTVLCFTASFSFAQSKEENKLVEFHMAFLRPTQKWDLTKTKDGAAILDQHKATIWSMLKSGKAVIVSHIGRDQDRVVILILRAASAAEAKTWVDKNAAVKAGFYDAELRPWWSADIFRPPTSPLGVETLYLGFLKRGSNRKEGDGTTPEVQELQKAHIANINRLAETRKLVVAGPFGDNGEYRGIFVFRVGSLKEAQDLAATDPMIKIDRLRLELHEWTVPAGVIP
jgi:uncharacterized protein YciI